MDSILQTVKQSLGITESVTAFDDTITMHINSILAQLGQIGFPSDVRISSSAETWSMFYTDPECDLVKSYICAKVRHMFDPPTGSLLTALEKNIDELEWRLYIWADSKSQE